MTESAVRCPPKVLRYWTAKYELNDIEIRIERDITPRRRAAGYYSPSDFLTVAIIMTLHNSKGVAPLSRVNSHFIGEVVMVLTTQENASAIDGLP